jgi:hypothetical protein
VSFQSYLTNIQAKTGKSASDFKAMATEKGFADDSGLTPKTKAGDIIAWLKHDYDLGRGHAMAIVAMLKGKES